MALELAIPDSGPLISLGRVARLDLLDRFNCPIVITDMVADEVLRGLPGAPDATVFRDWFSGRGNRIQTVETSIGILWSAIPPERRDILKRIRDAGETSIWQFSNTIRETMGPGDYGLLLFEESRVKSMDFGPRLAKITTWSFLIGLEEMGVIPSAEDFHRDIAGANRTIAKDPFEHQAERAEAGASWTDMYDMT